MAITPEPVAYATPSEVITQAAQDEVLALIDQLRAKFNSGVHAEMSSVPPDWIRMPPEMAVRLDAELVAMKTAIDAASTS